MRIFIPEYGRQILAGIRALAKMGHEVTLGAPGTGMRRNQGWKRYIYSRYLTEVIALPPTLDIERYVQAVIQVGAKGCYDVILPFGNNATSIVSHHRDTLQKYFAMAVPDYNVLVNAHDKARTFTLMENSEIPIPKTHVARSRDDLSKIESDIGYPAVIKARVNTGVQRGLRYANSRAELETALDALEGQTSVPGVLEYSEPLVQEFIPGELYDVCVLFNRGELRAALVQQRVLMYPFNGGVGVVNRTIDNANLLELGAEVGRLLNWHGPAQIEFKYDQRDKQFKLIEVNPKLWGTVDLSIRAGINFPDLTAKLAYDGDIQKIETYRVGVTYKWLIPHGLLLLMNAHSRKEALRALGKPWLYDTYYDFSLMDPIPDFVRLFSFIKSGFYYISGYKEAAERDKGRGLLQG